MWRLLWVRIGSRATFRPYTLYLLSIGCSIEWLINCHFHYLLARHSVTHRSSRGINQNRYFFAACSDLRSELWDPMQKFKVCVRMMNENRLSESAQQTLTTGRNLDSLRCADITLPTLVNIADKFTHSAHTKKSWVGWRGRDEGKRKKSWVILMQLGWAAEKAKKSCIHRAN